MQHLCYYQKNFKCRNLLQVSIPGSHDAATYTMLNAKASRYAVTQTKTLTQQFELGIRYFDIRIHRTKESMKGNERELVFFHGKIVSSKMDVYPNMRNFLDQIIISNEVVILKLHFKSREDFEVFQEIYFCPVLSSMIISTHEFKTKSIGALISSGKRIVLMINNAGKELDTGCDYKLNSFGGWAKTRDMKKLFKKMSEVRSTFNENALTKLRIVQTNQPALVGSGSGRFASVLRHDEQPKCRLIVNRFLDESRDLLTKALSDSDSLNICKVRRAISGVISLDNVGSDENKNHIVKKIINLNLDDDAFLSRNKLYFVSSV